MDHDYEITNVSREDHHIFDLEKLLKPAEYYASIHPTQYEEEAKARLEKEAKKAAAKALREAKNQSKK